MEKKETHLSKLVEELKDRGYGHTQKEVAESLEYTESSFSQIINGRVKVSTNFIQKVTSLIPEINIDWLRNGEGEMIKQSEAITGTEVREDEHLYNLPNSDKAQNEIVDHLLQALTAINSKNKTLKEKIDQLEKEIEILKNNQPEKK